MKPLFIKKNGTVTKVNPIITLSDNIPASDISYNNTTSGLSSTNTQSAIDEVVNTIDELPAAYHHAGTKTCSELISSLLIADNEGNVYNITDSGETTSDFIEGSGKPINIGDNVGIAKVGDNTYKFDLLAGLVDLTNYVQKSSTSGLLKNDGTIDTNTYLTEHQDITGKADKVSSATNGNLAGLNASGNPTDSGISGDMTTTSATGNPISIADLKSAQLALNPVITYNPIQDLHGQSKPYPAGGGKNKAPLVLDKLKAINFGTWSGNVYTYGGGTFTIQTDSAGNITGILVNGTFTNNTVFYIANSSEEYFATVANKTVILNGCPSGGSASTYSIGIWISGGGSVVDTGSGSSAITYPSSYANNNIAITCSGTISNKLFKPMVRLSTESDATFAPYSNISPISGYDKIEVLSCGKNLFDGTYSEPGYYLKSDGSTAYYPGAWNLSQYIPVKASTAYYFSNLSSTTSACIGWYNKAKEFISAMAIPSTGFTATSPANAVYLKCSVAVSSTNVCINEGSSAITYEPYHKTTDLSESLGQTVYGGTYDPRTGLFTVTHKMVDMGSLSWHYQGSTWQRFYADNVTDMKNAVIDTEDGCLCEILVTSRAPLGGSDAGDCAICLYNTVPYARWLQYNSDETGFKNAVTGKKLVYELATPFTIQLTPHEIALSHDYAYLSTNGSLIALTYHNGELASLSDIVQSNESINNRIDVNNSIIDISSYFVASAGTTDFTVSAKKYGHIIMFNISGKNQYQDEEFAKVRYYIPIGLSANEAYNVNSQLSTGNPIDACIVNVAENYNAIYAYGAHEASDTIYISGIYITDK